ncbi:MAG TPA: hypothetical protein VNJ29_03655 [Candidatus Nitrosotenuis sp.]|nr:hypothetical protein [Candidatus Nitrosotenuis sp.]
MRSIVYTSLKYSIMIFSACAAEVENPHTLVEQSINGVKLTLPQTFTIPQGYYKSESQITQQSLSRLLTHNFWDALLKEKDVNKATSYAIAAVINDVQNINDDLNNALEDRKQGILQKIRKKANGYERDVKKIVESMNMPVEYDSDE